MGKRLFLWCFVFCFACDCGDSTEPPLDSGTDGFDNDIATTDMSEPDVGIDMRDDDTSTSGASVYDVWEEYRERLRESPDHMITRSDEVVATGDPVQIFEFVRDNFQTIPPHSTIPFASVENRGYYGPRGTLRGTKGTPRDKVELLKHLLERAGYQSTVVRGIPDDQHRDIDILYRAIPRPAFAPTVSADDIQRWDDVFSPGSIAHPFTGVVDPGGTEADAISSSLAAFNPVPVNPAIAPDAFRLLPFLEVMIDGNPTFMNPLWPDAQVGDSFVGGVSSAADVVYPEIQVRVWSRSGRDDDPQSGETLVQGVWTEDELVGRRLVWRARPLLDIAELLEMYVDQVPLFLSSLSVESSEISAQERADLSTVGGIFSPLGWRMEEDADGAIRVNGVPIDADLDNDATQRGMVESIDVEANGDFFNDIVVHLAPKDANGNIVSGLTAQSFDVKEDGVDVSAIVTRNQSAPRLLLLLDNSGSVPPEYQGQLRTDLGLQIADLVFGVPGAEMVVMGMGESSNFYEDWTTDRTEIESQLNSVNGASSAMFESLATAISRGPTVVVMITDGQNFGATLTPELEAFYRDAGVPALVLGVPNEDPVILQAMADATSGTYASIADHAEALAEVQTILSAVDPTPYELRYFAPNVGAATRNVTVGIRDARGIEGNGTYDVPQNAQNSRGMFGLYMTITRGNRSVTRTLAGLPHTADTDLATDAHVAHVRDALFGSTTLIVEGGAPTWSHVLDDAVSAQLSTKAMWDARNGDVDEFWDVVREGFDGAPVEPYMLLQDPPTLDTLAEPIGSRLVLYSVHPSSRGVENSMRRYDILPLNRYAGVSLDPMVAFQAGMRRSVHDAVMEKGFFPDSTIEFLEGEALTMIDAQSVPAFFAANPNAEQWAQIFTFEPFSTNWQAVVPTDGDPVAYWVIEESTGTTIAGMPGGGGAGEAPGGGGSTDAAVRLGELLAELHSLTGMGGGVWLELEIAKAKIVAYATAAILNLETWNGTDPDNPDFNPEEVVEDFACGVAEGLVTDLLPDALQEALDAYGDFAGASGAPDASFCD